MTTASAIWSKVDARIAEAAADSIGFDTAVSWTHAIKTIALLFVSCFGIVLTGYSLAYSADNLIGFYGQYDDDTKTEGDDKNDASNDDPDGTSIQWDLLIVHGLETFYAWFVFSAISYGGFIFYSLFNPLDDNIECDFNVPASQYDGTMAIIGNVKDYESCMANIDDVFKKLDANGNGFIERCEDANFQHAMGSTKEYSTKFSSEFSVAGLRALCKENFYY